VRGFRKDRRAWDVLICDHHEGYISWAEFERNQRPITDIANAIDDFDRAERLAGGKILKDAQAITSSAVLMLRPS
jgi:hypothetical protein